MRPVFRSRLRTAVVVGGVALLWPGLCGALTLSGVVRDTYLVTGMAITEKTPAVLKLKFENKTSGTNLSLCAGTPEEFKAGGCPLALSDSGGPGFEFLTVTDTLQLAGRHIWVKNNGPVKPASFALTVE